MGHVCRICGTADNHRTFLAREMMFGTKEEFEYFMCDTCGCLQITDIPSDLSHYYPKDYYSFSIEKRKPVSELRQFLLKQRFRNAIFNKGYKVNKLLERFIEIPEIRLDRAVPVSEILKISRVQDFSARFLDIGCGSWSQWMESLKIMGFRNCSGYDPFIEKDVDQNGISIYKNKKSVTGEFELITLHHSLEHIPDQKEILEFAHAHLAPKGVLLVRIPTVSSYAWEHYGTDWVELDPPRHLYLHSRGSIRKLGKMVGLSLYKTICDSISFEFYGSEQYRHEISLTDSDSYWMTGQSSLFSPEDIDRFETMAQEVNLHDECGRACFFFTRSESS